MLTTASLKKLVGGKIMKVISIILLVALFLLPTHLVVTQSITPTATPVPSPSPSATTDASKLVKKTSKVSPVKVVNRPPPPLEYDIKDLQFFPPSNTFVPSTKASVMTSVVCFEKTFVRVTTEGIIPFSMSVIKLSGTGEILILQEDGSYVAYSTDPMQINLFRTEDVKLAQKIVKTFKPKKLSIMPNLVAMEKVDMKTEDPFALVEILRDHMGREAYDVNVAKPSDCYKIPIPTPTVTPTPVMTLTPTPSPSPEPTVRQGDS